MRKIISSLDIGSDSIKLVVGEIFERRLHILSASKIESSGLERNKVVDGEALVASIKEAIDASKETLGIDVEKCVLSLNMVSSIVNKSAAAIKIDNQDGLVNGKDVQKVMNKCADGKVPEDYALVSVIPVEFTIDNDIVIEYPVGQKSKNLGIKAVVVSSPKDYVSSMLEVVNKAGLKVLDVVPGSLCDYYSYRTDKTDATAGIVVNMGSEVTTVSYFEDGILNGLNTFRNGGQNVINDISFICKIEETDARAIYKDITLASSKLANPNEYRLITNIEGEEIKLNQLDMSEIAYSRIADILNLVKKQINILTKTEISYIIVTGGLTELRDFNYALDAEFNKLAILGKLDLVGARDNSYSTAVGAIKLYDEKLQIKGKTVSIFSNKELENMKNNERDSSASNNTLLDKVFGIFFDN